MSRRSAVSVIAVATVGFAVSACTGTTSGSGKSVPTSAPSGPSSATSAATNLPYAGAPSVTHPLPETVLSGDPCKDALTATQVDTLLGSPVQSERDDLPPLGPQCRWSNLDRGTQVDVGYDIKTHAGLSGLYQNTKPQSGVWKPIANVQGFPAVAHGGNPGQPPKDICVVSVGLADNFSINVSIVLSTAKQGTTDPCDVAGQAADAAVTTLKAKAGS